MAHVVAPWFSHSTVVPGAVFLAQVDVQALDRYGLHGEVLTVSDEPEMLGQDRVNLLKRQRHWG